MKKKYYWIIGVAMVLIIGFLFCILFSYCSSFGCKYCGIIYIRSNLPIPLEECIARLANQCVRCKFMDWNGKTDFSEPFDRCIERHWYNLQINFDECIDIKQFCNETVGEVLERH